MADADALPVRKLIAASLEGGESARGGVPGGRLTVGPWTRLDRRRALEKAVQTLFHDGERPSWITLPVVP